MARRAKGAAPSRAKGTKRTSPTKRKAPAAKKMVGKQIKTRRTASVRAASGRKGAATRTVPPVGRPVETVVVDTIEEPVPGIVVVTETEYAVERVGQDNPARSRASARQSKQDGQ